MNMIVRTLMVLLLFAVPALSAEQRHTVPLNDSPRTGPENAPITIIEFIDFQ